MKRIEKHFCALRIAEWYLDELYCEYDSVQCVHAPTNGYGVYVFVCE